MLGDLPDPGIEPTFLESHAVAGGFLTISATWEAHSLHLFYISPLEALVVFSGRNREGKGQGESYSAQNPARREGIHAY